MKLGYMAIDERSGEMLSLIKTEHPRKQLLEKLGRGSAAKMFVDTANNGTKHIGYVVARQWWRIYEVHDWSRK